MRENFVSRCRSEIGVNVVDSSFLEKTLRRARFRVDAKANTMPRNRLGFRDGDWKETRLTPTTMGSSERYTSFVCFWCKKTRERTTTNRGRLPFTKPKESKSVIKHYKNKLTSVRKCQWDLTEAQVRKYQSQELAEWQKNDETSIASVRYHFFHAHDHMFFMARKVTNVNKGIHSDCWQLK